MEDELRGLVQQLAKGDSRSETHLKQRQATVQSWPAESYVNLRFPGSTVDVPAAYVRTYAPVAGDVVWVLQNGPDLLVLGRSSGSNSWLNDPNMTRGVDNDFNLLQNRPSGFYQAPTPTNSPDGAGASTTWWNLINARHNNTANNYGFQIAARMTGSQNDLFWRNYQGGSGTDGSVPGGAWNRIIHDGLGLSPQTAFVVTTETTTTTTYTDLTTVGPDVTVTVPPSGTIWVAWSMQMSGTANALMSVEVYNLTTSTTVSAASDDRAVYSGTTAGYQFSNGCLYSGLTPGHSVRVRAKYRASSGTTTCSRRRVTVTPTL
jgi:hypothetical protein